MVPKTINELGLVVAGESEKEGYYLAVKGMTAFSYGENIAVFITKVDEQTTSVEVVSKKTLGTNVFAANWQKPFLNKLEEMLDNSEEN